MSRRSPPPCTPGWWADGPSRARMRRRLPSGSPPTRAPPTASSMANGTVTMEVALKALGIGWGDEVIVPALTFAATAYAAMAAGALPVIVDVDPGHLTLDPAAVEAAITPRTRAIMPVHLAQQMADMDRLMADRRPPRPARRRGLRPRPRTAVERPGRGLHRRLRLVLAPVEQDPHLGRGWNTADQRRSAGAPRPLADRLRAAQGRRRERIHLRRQLPAGRTAGGAAPARTRAVRGPAGATRGGRRRVRTACGGHPRGESLQS